MMTIEPTRCLVRIVAGQITAAVRTYWPLSAVAEEWRPQTAAWLPAPALLDTGKGIDWQLVTAAVVDAWITDQTAAAA